MKDTAKRLVNLLTAREMTVTTAESCTGGLVSAAITAIPGASSVLDGAIVTYSPGVKGRFLGIDPTILYEIGVVSPECAKAMAEGVAKLFHADCSIALTGYAGPGGGDEKDPVGTVYAGITLFGKTVVHRFSIEGDRDNVRTGAAKRAMELLCEMLEG